MRKIFLFLLVINLYLFAAVTFEKTFGGLGDDVANSIRQTSDGGYIVASESDDSLYSGMIMLKIDHLGNEQWTSHIHGYSDATNEGFSAIETNDGGFIIAGNVWLEYHGIWSFIYVRKTDSSGETLWNYIYAPDSSASDTAYEIIQTDDSGFIIIGYSILRMTSMMIKLDSEGKEEWVNYDLGPLRCRSVIQTEDKGFITTGFNEENIILFKTDSLGNKEWDKGLGGLASKGYSVKQASDGGFIIFGKTSRMTYADMAWLIKTDANGEMEWDKQYGYIDSQSPLYNGRSVYITSDGGYILAGYSDSFESADVWLIKTDSEGNEIWSKTYGGAGDDRAYSVQQTSDGGYILAGYTDSVGAGGKDMWIIKTDENGTEIESPFIPQTTELHQNYPNPFNPTTEISYVLKSEGLVTLSVFNAKGELVSSLVNSFKPTGNHSVNFNGEGLNSGIYFYKLEVNGFVVNSKRMLMLK